MYQMTGEIANEKYQNHKWMMKMEGSLNCAQHKLYTISLFMERSNSLRFVYKVWAHIFRILTEATNESIIISYVIGLKRFNLFCNYFPFSVFISFGYEYSFF